MGDFTLTSDEKMPGSTQKKPVTHTKNRDMGSALRSVYQKAVDESVPDDLLALLGKLD